MKCISYILFLSLIIIIILTIVTVVILVTVMVRISEEKKERENAVQIKVSKPDSLKGKVRSVRKHKDFHRKRNFNGTCFLCEREKN